MIRGSKRRSKLEIYIDILNAVLNGERKTTRIMYAANLSSESVRRSLEGLVKEGYLESSSYDANKRTKRTYSITPKGVRALRYFKGAEILVDVDYGKATVGP